MGLQSMSAVPAMTSFEFTSVPKIVFGRGKITQLGDLARPLGSRALMIHNGDDPGRSGPVDRAADSLRAANIPVTFHRQRGEPTTTDIDAALAIARAHQCDFLIAVGGGSAIDAAKATAGLLTNGGAALDYMEVTGQGRKITTPAAPWIAIPTTAGTGAEVTRNAVIGSPEDKFKASIRSEHLLARAALIGPELGINAPADVTAASGMDALCQCIESFTSIGANELTEPIAEHGALSVIKTIRRAYANGSDVDAREGMALGALCSGIALSNAGLGAVHGFAAPIGANFPIPHGVVCARLLPGVIAANAAALCAESPEHPTFMKYEALGVYASALRLPERSEPLPVHGYPPHPAEKLIAYVTDLVRDLAIPPLSQFGLREEHIPSMVSLAKKSSSMRYNPVVLADDALSNILRSAL